MARLSATVLAASALLDWLPAGTLAAAPPGTIGFPFQKKRVAVEDVPSLVRRSSSTVLTTVTNDVDLYLINVTVGTPAQSIALQLDTGSSDIWFPASSASICDETDGCPYGSYDSSASSTYTELSDYGEFDISYVDGTEYEGTYLTDTLRIGSTTLTNMTMAQVTTLSSQGIGVMGIAFTDDETSEDSTDSFTYPNVIDVLKSEGFIKKKAYSLWLDDLEAGTGTILFGGVDSSKYTGDLVTLPIQIDSDTDEIDSFTVAWTSLTISGGGNDVDLSPSSAEAAILDSGTTLTLLPDDIATSIFNGVGVITDATYGNLVPCKLSVDDLVFSFGFGGSKTGRVNVSISEMVLPLETNSSSTLKFDNGEDACTFGIEAAGSDPILFGDTFLRSAYVVYDLDDQLIGIAQTNFDASDSDGDVQAFVSGSSGIPGASTTLTAASVAVTVTGDVDVTEDATASASGTVEGTSYSTTFHLSATASYTGIEIGSDSTATGTSTGTGTGSSSTSTSTSTSSSSSSNAATAATPLDRSALLASGVVLAGILLGSVLL